MSDTSIFYATINGVPHELEEHDDTRRARIAAEILSADVWPISSALIENEELLAKLWSILRLPSPLTGFLQTKKSPQFVRFPSRSRL